MNLWQDLRYSVRTLRKAPGFTAIAAVTLALGIGANTAMFSVVHSVVLRPLPYPDAEHIVTANASMPDYRDLQDRNQVFDKTAIWASNLFNLSSGAGTQQILGGVASPSFFEILGSARLGHTFTAEEETHPVAIISHDL